MSGVSDFKSVGDTEALVLNLGNKCSDHLATSLETGGKRSQTKQNILHEALSAAFLVPLNALFGSAAQSSASGTHPQTRTLARTHTYTHINVTTWHRCCGEARFSQQ